MKTLTIEEHEAAHDHIYVARNIRVLRARLRHHWIETHGVPWDDAATLIEMEAAHGEAHI
jgi:hypothetical protein